jgi:hypothetical protein
MLDGFAMKDFISMSLPGLIHNSLNHNAFACRALMRKRLQLSENVNVMMSHCNPCIGASEFGTQNHVNIF